MTSTISFPMIERSTEEEYLWQEEPERIASELYPDSPPSDGRSRLSDGDIAFLAIYGILETFTFESERLPKWLESDQLEDYLAARAVKQVILTRDVGERLRRG